MSTHPQTETSAESTSLHVGYHDWHNLAASGDTESFLDSWLAIIISRINAVRCASVLLPATGGALEPTGNWPKGRCDLSQQALSLAQEAADQREALVEQAAAGETPDKLYITYPLALDEGVAAVVTMEIGARSDDELEDVLHQLQLGSAWIELLFRREQSDTDQTLVSQAISTLSILSRVTAHADPIDAASELVTSVASELSCERVTYGVVGRSDVDIIALSNAGQFGRKMNLIRLVSQAMLEALDQDRIINFPGGTSSSGAAANNHLRLVEESRTGSVLTLPISSGDRQVGAMLLERAADRPFSHEESAIAETLADIAGGMIADKMESRRSLPGLAFRRAGRWASSTLRLRHPLRTALLLGVTALVIALSVVEARFEVRADARLEGLYERAVVAPFDGYIDAADKRVGDRVEAGEMLGRMDTTEFELELVDLTSKKSQAQNQIREARATGNRAQVRIVQTQVAQIDAQIDQVEARIERTVLAAPYEGTIIRGDLSRQLGGAVTRGEVLFEVAPLDAYRVALQVDERDIAHVDAGASVSLVLSSRTNESIPLSVDRITPIASAEEGANSFRVEAILEDPAESLRPGMEGIARIAAGERSLLWIWTRDFVNWLRMAFWRWLP